MDAERSRSGPATALADALAALRHGDGRLSAKQLDALSGLGPDGRARVRDELRELNEAARFAVLDLLISEALESPLWDFSAICLACLDDPAPAVRALAVGGLTEADGREVLRGLAGLAQDDPDELVREEAAAALGPFALRSEFGRLTSADAALVVDTLRALAEDPAEVSTVRAAALESVGALSQEWVRDLIQEAYLAGDTDLRLGALRAMGRSADDYWLPTVLDLFSSADSDERAAAAAAAGEIAAEEAIDGLRDLLQDESPEVVQAALGALGEIGGAEARDLLQQFATHPAADLRIAAQAALGLVEFAEDPLGFGRRGG